jgi:ATP-binding cassette subfamily C (CFTR/MRP) protein 10
VLFVVLMQAVRNSSDWWLSHWVEHDTAHSARYYLEIYGYISSAAVVITVVRSFLFAYAGLKAAERLHDWLLTRIVETHVSFFDSTPIGTLRLGFCCVLSY